MIKDPTNLRLPTFWKPKFVSLKNFGHNCTHYKWQSLWIIFTIHITKDLPSQALKNGMDWFASSDSLRCWNNIILRLSKSLTELVSKITKTEQIWNDYAAKCKKLKIRMKDRDILQIISYNTWSSPLTAYPSLTEAGKGGRLSLA